MKIKDIMEFAPMTQPVQKPVDGQVVDGTLLPDGSYAKNTDHYDPAFVARIKTVAAQPSLGAMPGADAIEHFKRLLSQAGHGR